MGRGGGDGCGVCGGDLQRQVGAPPARGRSRRLPPAPLPVTAGRSRPSCGAPASRSRSPRSYRGVGGSQPSSSMRSTVSANRHHSKAWWDEQKGGQSGGPGRQLPLASDAAAAGASAAPLCALPPLPDSSPGGRLSSVAPSGRQRCPRAAFEDGPGSSILSRVRGFGGTGRPLDAREGELRQEWQAETLAAVVHQYQIIVAKQHF